MRILVLTVHYMFSLITCSLCHLQICAMADSDDAEDLDEVKYSLRVTKTHEQWIVILCNNKTFLTIAVICEVEQH